jgi:hypothetical protein
MSINIDELTIGQAKEIAALFPAAAAHEEPYNRLAPDNLLVIAVLQRGHVAIGVYEQRGLIARLSKAAIIRRWGTTDGLGELAAKGPLENTKLDKCGEISFHIREAVMVMNTEVTDAWRNYVNKY